MSSSSLPYYNASFEGATHNNIHHSKNNNTTGVERVVSTGLHSDNTPSISSSSRGSLKIIVGSDVNPQSSPSLPPTTFSSPNRQASQGGGRVPPATHHLPPIATPLSSSSRTHSHHRIHGTTSSAAPLPPISLVGASHSRNNSIVEIPVSSSTNTPMILPPGSPTWASSDLEDSGMGSLYHQHGSSTCQSFQQQQHREPIHGQCWWSRHHLKEGRGC